MSSGADELRLMIGALLLDGKRGKKCLVKNIDIALRKRGWNNFKSDVMSITSWMPQSFNLKQRMYCIYAGIGSLPVCPSCGGMICKIHQQPFIFGFNKYCCQSCARANNDPFSSKTDDEIKEIHSRVGMKHRGKIVSGEARLKMSLSACRTMEKKRATCKARYGVENPGVMGAYYSASALRFIRALLADMFIEEGRTYFRNGGVNGREFFQNVGGKYVSYDLVVFNTVEAAQSKDMSQIQFVLEYNGPWHYLESEVPSIGHQGSHPYSGSQKTVSEVVEFDRMKKEHMMQFTSDYRVVWQRDGIKRRMGYIPEGLIVAD